MATAELASKRPLLLRILDFPLVALVVALIFYIAAAALGIILGKYVSLGEPATAIAQNAINLMLIVAVYKLAIARLGEHPKDDLPAAGSLPDLGKGLVLGAGLFGVVVGVAALLGVYRIIGPGDGSTLLLQLVTVAIVPGVTEELLFRGILFRWIEEFAGSWAALLVTSALFGLAHIMNANATWFSSFAIAVEAGLLLGGAYMLTRNLWMAIGLHAAWNFTQGTIFSIPVSGNPARGLVTSELAGPAILSGGGFGLEASVIALVIATGAGVWLVWLAVRRGQLVDPWWVRRSS